MLISYARERRDIIITPLHFIIAVDIARRCFRYLFAFSSFFHFDAITFIIIFFTSSSFRH